MDDSIDRWLSSDRVYQAQGIVSVQADCTVDEALDWMTEKAEESGMSLDAVAVEIIERRMRYALPR